MSKGYRKKLFAVAKENTFQRSLAAVNEQSPIFRFILWHSKLVQKLSNICTAHQVFLFKEKTEELLMSVVVKDDVSLSERRLFSFNLDANSLTEDVDKLRSGTRSFNFF